MQGDDVPRDHRPPFAARGLRRERRHVHRRRGHAVGARRELERVIAGARDPEVPEARDARRIGRDGRRPAERPTAEAMLAVRRRPLRATRSSSGRRPAARRDRTPRRQAETGGLVVMTMAPPAPADSVIVLETWTSSRRAEPKRVRPAAPVILEIGEVAAPLLPVVRVSVPPACPCRSRAMRPRPRRSATGCYRRRPGSAPRAGPGRRHCLAARRLGRESSSGPSRRGGGGEGHRLKPLTVAVVVSSPGSGPRIRWTDARPSLAGRRRR